MSMITAPAGYHPTTGVPLRYMLAMTVAEHRQALDLSAERAAALSGLNLGQWLAIECGNWVPEEQAVIRAVADTLEFGYLALSLVAEISRHWVAQGKN